MFDLTAHLTPDLAWRKAGGAGAITPAFQADFTALSALPTGVSFSRASNAMVTDNIGNLTYAPNNYVTDSFYGGAALRTATGLSDPDGGNNAIQVTFVAANQEFFQTYIVSGKTINSVWIKGISGETIAFASDDTSGSLFTLTGAWQQIYLSGANANSNRYVDIGTFLGATARVVQVYKPVIAQVTYETTPRTQDQVLNSGSVYYGPRFDHAWNGSAWVATGILIDEQRTNLLLDSNNLGSLNWTLGSGSVSQNAVGPDGATNSALTWTSASGVSNELYQPVAVAAGSTFSIYVKTGSGSPWLGVQAYDGGRRTTYFQPATGTIGTVGGATGSPTVTQSNAVFAPLANGWYRASVTNNSNATSYFILWMADADAGGSTVTGTKSLILADAQAEVGSFATSYIPTTTAAVTRSADIAQLTGAALAALQGSAFSLVMELGQVANAANSPRFISEAGADQPLLYTNADPGPAIDWNGSAAAITGNTVAWSSGNHRAALSSDATGRSIVLDGGTVVTAAGAATAYSAPVGLGYNAVGSDGYIDGYLRSIAIYSSRLSDADLQAKSVVGAAF